ncbi:MAG TPA: DUF3347 domain-containing protein [Chitinophagaceae bacterium]|nr:DUF3347 domain-containing protein [Chitinophagaceae bacterium]
MEKLIFLVIVTCYTSFSAMAQHEHSSHQNENTDSKNNTITKTTVTGGNSQKQLSGLLSSYYNLKNALVTGDAGSAASNADVFLKTANTIDFKVISEGNIHILSKDAGKISGTKDLKKQREYFMGLSSNMATLAKSLKLANQPIYLQYCPMKKATWLSSEKGIRNPYYGSSMLTCGEVRETL